MEQYHYTCANHQDDEQTGKSNNQIYPNFRPPKYNSDLNTVN